MVRTLAQGFLIAGITPIALANSTVLSTDSIDNKNQVISGLHIQIDNPVFNSSCTTLNLSTNCLESNRNKVEKLEIKSDLWLGGIANSLPSDSFFLNCGHRSRKGSRSIKQLLPLKLDEAIQSRKSLSTVFPDTQLPKIFASSFFWNKPAKEKCIFFGQQQQLERKLVNLESIKQSKITTLNPVFSNDYSPPKVASFPQLSRSSLIVAFPQEDSSFVPVATKLANPAPETKRIASRFGWRKRPYSNQLQFHQGIDYGAPYSSPVVAVGNGIVTRVVSGCADFGNLFCGGQLGNWIEIDHGNGKIGTYGHLKRSSITVTEGMKVWKNQNIAQVGSSGWSTGAHLDFRLKVNGKHEDPAKYVMAIEPQKTRVAK